MTKEVRHSEYKKPLKQSLKNKNMKLDLLLMQMFNFRYAGKCNIFIHTRRDKFELVHDGVHIVEDLFTFSPNYLVRFKFDSLYDAISAFNLSVRIVTSSMDWYSTECFKGQKIYDEIFYKD